MNDHRRYSLRRSLYVLSIPQRLKDARSVRSLQVCPSRSERGPPKHSVLVGSSLSARKNRLGLQSEAAN